MPAHRSIRGDVLASNARYCLSLAGGSEEGGEQEGKRQASGAGNVVEAR
jgi:hypothetical protein